MRKSLINGILYAFVVAAAVSASAVVFLVALDVRESAGMGAFLLSLLLFPLTWVAGPIVLAAGGNSALMPLLAFSLAMAAPPLLATWAARRGARRRAEARRSEGRDTRSRAPVPGADGAAFTAGPEGEPLARPHPLAAPPPVAGARPPMPLPPPPMMGPRGPMPGPRPMPGAAPPPGPMPLHPPAAG